MSLKAVRNTILFISLLILSGGIGFRLGETSLKFTTKPVIPFVEITHKEPSILTNVDFGLFWDVWRRLEQQYLDKSSVNPQKMVYGAISGMVSSIGDPYTVFLTPDQNKDSKEELGGSFEGIGAQLGFKDHQIIVIAPLVGAPAEKAGIRPGDAILMIDGRETNGMTLPEAVSKIRGPKGTTVKLSILHEKEEKAVELTIARETIVVKSVEWEKRSISGKNVAYLKLLRFGDNTNSEWDKAVFEITKANVTGVVLDLRNDPGGYLSGAVYIASEFLPDGVIVIQEATGGERVVYKVNRKGNILRQKLVVLMNRGSASASEIVAGALQDRKRAVLVGENTFGKGTVQEAVDLENGAGLHITTAKWLLPSGRWIDKAGLTPDYPVSPDEKNLSKDIQLEKALTLVTSQ
jgi:carboxyl-terminal processing protease